MTRPEFARIATNGISLEVAVAGPVDGPLLLLLHGFPEGWYGWNRQIGPLAAAGYRVLAPEQRGYGRSEKPRGVSAYALDSLADDVVGLIDAMGRDKATVVGHDWGGLVAWGALGRHPSRFERAVILNAPHPDAMLRTLQGDPVQWLKSWYALFFQIPGLPEILLRWNNFGWLVRAMSRSSRSGTFSETDFENYRGIWAEPGALTAMIHWYRAGLRHRHAPFSSPLIDTPTLIIWGMRDRFLGPGLARTSFAQCESASLEWIDSSSHWVQHEEPDRVNHLILAFLGEV